METDTCQEILVLYAYYESGKSKENLDFFCKYAINNQELEVNRKIKFVLINNSKTNSCEIGSRWDKVYYRENYGRDFGAWNYALQKENHTYDYYFFINDTVRGPYGKQDWMFPFISLIDDQTKLVGTSMNCYSGRLKDSIIARISDQKKIPMPHVQSMFLCTDRIGYEILVKDGIFSFDSKNNRRQIIINQEIGSSFVMLNNGYNISCVLSEYQKDFRKGFNALKEKLPFNRKLYPEWYFNENNGCCGDVLALNAYFGRSLKPEEVIFFKTVREPSHIL